MHLVFRSRGFQGTVPLDPGGISPLRRRAVLLQPRPTGGFCGRVRLLFHEGYRNPTEG
jgi:hypothetical protein